MDFYVNYVAILLAGVASMVVGFAWYSPMLFAKPWMKLMGHSADSMKKTQKDMGGMYALSFVLSLITAFVLAHVIQISEIVFDHTTLQAGIFSALGMWFGFIMPVQATDVIFGGKKWKLFGINTGYQLASLLVMGVVLSFML